MLGMNVNTADDVRYVKGRWGKAEIAVKKVGGDLEFSSYTGLKVSLTEKWSAGLAEFVQRARSPGDGGDRSATGEEYRFGDDRKTNVVAEDSAALDADLGPCEAVESGSAATVDDTRRASGPWAEPAADVLQLLGGPTGSGNGPDEKMFCGMVFVASVEVGISGSIEEDKKLLPEEDEEERPGCQDAGVKCTECAL